MGFPGPESFNPHGHQEGQELCHPGFPVEETEVLRVEQKSQGAALLVSSNVPDFTGGEYSSVHPCGDFYELLSVFVLLLKLQCALNMLLLSHFSRVRLCATP